MSGSDLSLRKAQLDKAEREHLEDVVTDLRKLVERKSYIDEVWEEDGEPPALMEYKALAEEIDDRCQAVDRAVPSDWVDRALSEITTAGYQPNHKHGVEINITPLAEQNIVPDTVDDEVLW